MTLTELPRAQWQQFFDRASKELGARPTKVEVTGLGLGDQLAAEWVELIGVTYEPKDDMLTVAVEGLQHRIEHPKAIHVERDAQHLASMEVLGPDGTHHIIQFSAPLELPAP
jgi:hypothetical protein